MKKIGMKKAMKKAMKVMKKVAMKKAMKKSKKPAAAPEAAVASVMEACLVGIVDRLDSFGVSLNAMEDRVRLNAMEDRVRLNAMEDRVVRILQELKSVFSEDYLGETLAELRQELEVGRACLRSEVRILQELYNELRATPPKLC